MWRAGPGARYSVGTRAFSSSTPFCLSTLALRCKRKHERHGGAALSPALDLDAAAGRSGPLLHPEHAEGGDASHDSYGVWTRAPAFSRSRALISILIMVGGTPPAPAFPSWQANSKS